MTKKSDRWAKLADDLRAAKEAAHAAASDTEDGGSCNVDNVRIGGVRWCAGLERALREAGVTGHRRTWLGLAYVELGFGHGGQAAKNTAGVEAACDVLQQRGWQASVFYMAD